MNSCQTPHQPPVESLPKEGAGSLVAVRVVVPDPVITSVIYPVCNRIGTEMLSRLLKHRIESAGVPVQAVNYGLPFNRAFYLFDLGAGTLKPALEAVQRELAELRVLGWSQIAWYDAREGVFRMHHPIGGAFLEATASELKAEAAFVALASTELKKLDNPEGET